MREKNLQRSEVRRSFLSRLGIGALGAATLARLGSASTPLDTSWRPARHTQDDWLDEIPGVHRVVFDTTTAAWMALALHFGVIYLATNRNAYKLQDSDSAVVIIVRHKSTVFGYNDEMWAKYSQHFSEYAEFIDPQTKETPKVNLYGNMGIDMLVKRGVHFAVCQTATETVAWVIADKSGVGLDGL